MFNELVISQTIGFKNMLCMYMEEVKSFFEKICYYISKYELKI